MCGFPLSSRPWTVCAANNEGPFLACSCPSPARCSARASTIFAFFLRILAHALTVDAFPHSSLFRLPRLTICCSVNPPFVRSQHTHTSGHFALVPFVTNLIIHPLSSSSLPPPPPLRPIFLQHRSHSSFPHRPARSLNFEEAHLFPRVSTKATLIPILGTDRTLAFRRNLRDSARSDTRLWYHRYYRNLNGPIDLRISFAFGTT